ncbi:MAG: hypothetical protein IJO85_05115 [Lachnospiraceae bacterium]|nr:hypothetical protein [Lachnospiraceae bacterium]
MSTRKISKRYMFYCSACKNLTFLSARCEKCGKEDMVQTPKRYGLTNLACISMSVMDFEAMKQEFVTELNAGQIK